MNFQQHLFRNRYSALAIAAAAGLLAAEVICRFGFGLGDPPLEILDPACGYRFSPSQEVGRFGNRVSYDANSARGIDEDLPIAQAWKTLVIGDSVLNGGTLTDDQDTASAVLNGLAFSLNGRTLRFLNLSAGSWAPPQQLGYLNAYGTLGADSVVMVLSSHDALGLAKGGKSPFPTVKPWTATEELVLRYLMGYRRHLFTSAPAGWKAAAADVPSDVAASEDPTATSVWCLKQIVGLCRRKNLPLAVVLWPNQSEAATKQWDQTADVFLQVLVAEKVPYVDLMPQITATPNFETTVYRDGIHPTPAGQRLVAGAVLQLTLQMGPAER